MNFTNSDIKRLYGSKFFILPGHTTSTPIENPVEDLATTLDHPEAEVTLTKEEVQAPEPQKESPPVVAATSPAWYLSGEAVSWKMRPTSTLALVMAEEEFSNRMLTYALKQCVEEAGIPGQEIGFGVLKGQGPNWNFSDMPTTRAVVFSSIKKEKDIYLFDNKHIYLQPRIQDIALNTEAQQALTKLLSSIYSD